MFSRDKGKAKPGRGHKNAPKSGNTAQATVSSEEEPDNLGFIYSIDILETKYDEKHQPRILRVGGSKGNDIASFWFPPNRANQFKRRYGNLYRWPGEIESELVPNVVAENLKRFQVVSVFFQQRQDNFLAVWKDCAKHDIANDELGWSQIGFHHLPGHLSMVDIGGQKFTLAAPAIDCPWMPQVLPEVYDYDLKNPSAIFPGASGGLCGRLSLIIAMAAFSAPVNQAENVVSKCFGYKNWESHDYPTGIGRYQDRGVVVSVYLDPEAEGVTAKHLKAFEDGKYGPVFAPLKQEPEPGYTFHPVATTVGHGTNATPRSPNPSYMVPTVPNTYATASGSFAASGYPSRTITDSIDYYNAEDNQPDDQLDDQTGRKRE